MRPARFRRGMLGLALTLAWASGADAQGLASSLAELAELGHTKTVIVTDTTGREFRGTMADASESLVSLWIGSQVRSFAAADIRSVRTRKEDSLANGALIGAALGGGLTSLQFLDNECRDDPVCYETTAVYAGLGALAGLGIDALIHASVVVYSAPSGAGPSVTAAPVVANGRRGVRVTVAF